MQSSEFLKSHGLMVVQPCKILRFACANKKNNEFTLFYIFPLMFHTYYESFTDIFAVFLELNLNTKVWTAHKNLLLECLSQFN